MATHYSADVPECEILKKGRVVKKISVFGVNAAR